LVLPLVEPDRPALPKASGGAETFARPWDGRPQVRQGRRRSCFGEGHPVSAGRGSRNGIAKPLAYLFFFSVSMSGAAVSSVGCSPLFSAGFNVDP